MPFKSKAQKRRLLLLVEEGKFSQENFDVLVKESEGLILPETSPKQVKSLIRGVRQDARARKK